MAALYGSLLTFKTIRVGFPDEQIVVIDNGSIGAAKWEIEKAAVMVGAGFIPAYPEVQHWVCLRQALATFDGPLVFCDPDLVFWKRMQLRDDCMWSGRLIPKFRDEYSDCVTMPRLHTSLLSVPDAKAMLSFIEATERKFWESNLLRPAMVPAPWTRYDTGAMLYAEISGEAFSEDQLDCYDHLFCGSHLSHVAHTLDGNAKQEMIDSHEIAKSGNLEGLRGIWRRQQKHFTDRGIP